MEGVKDRTWRGFSDTRIEELMDSRTFKASRSRRVNDIEFRINVCPSPRPASASQGGAGKGHDKGQQEARVFKASLLANRAVEHAVWISHRQAQAEAGAGSRKS